MALKTSDFIVRTDAGGNVKCITAPGEMSIPPDPMNSRYQEFLAVDTEKELCARQTIRAPVVPTGPTLEDRLAALEAGQKTIATKVGVTLVSKEIA
jgi:hypothetical protein